MLCFSYFRRSIRVRKSVSFYDAAQTECVPESKPVENIPEDVVTSINPRSSKVCNKHILVMSKIVYSNVHQVYKIHSTNKIKGLNKSRTCLCVYLTTNVEQNIFAFIPIGT